jgi:hypothetical protein
VDNGSEKVYLFLLFSVLGGQSLNYPAVGTLHYLEESGDRSHKGRTTEKYPSGHFQG